MVTVRTSYIGDNLNYVFTKYVQKMYQITFYFKLSRNQPEPYQRAKHTHIE